MIADEPTKPDAEIRFGKIKAAIWRTDSATGARFNITIERLYKNDQGKWAFTPQFGVEDLLLVAKVADQAHTYIHSQKQFEKALENSGLDTK